MSGMPGLRPLARVLDDVLLGVASRPWRATLCAFGVFVGATAVVVVVGLSATSQARVSALFDADRSPYVVARPPQDGSLTLTIGDLRRVDELPAFAAVAAGLSRGETFAEGRPPGTAQGETLNVLGVRGDVVDAAGLELVAGRGFDAGHEARRDRVVLLGRGAAGRLGIGGVDGHNVLYLDGRPYLVIGLFERAAADPALSFAAFVPRSAMPGSARDDDRLDVVYALAATRRTGAAASVLAARLSPVAPGRLNVTFDAGAGQVAEQVSAELANLTLGLLLAAAVVGTLVVATVMTTSVTERRGEIGLRRALGAHPGEVAAQFLLEGLLLGAAGAAAGAAAGVAVLWGVTQANAWPFVLPGWLPWLTLAQGAAVGTVAAAIAAARAARLDPHLALTSQ